MISVHIRVAILLGGLTTFAGCAQQRVMQQITAAKATCDTYLSDTRIDPVRGKVALKPAEVSIQMMIIQEVPAEEEKRALSAFFDAKAICDRTKLEAATQAEPENVFLLKAAYAKYDQVYAHLYQGNISYGNANQLLQQAHLESVGQYNSVIQ